MKKFLLIIFCISIIFLASCCLICDLVKIGVLPFVETEYKTEIITDKSIYYYDSEQLLKYYNEKGYEFVDVEIGIGAKEYIFKKKTIKWN